MILKHKTHVSYGSGFFIYSFQTLILLVFTIKKIWAELKIDLYTKVPFDLKI